MVCRAEVQKPSASFHPPIPNVIKTTIKHHRRQWLGYSACGGCYQVLYSILKAEMLQNLERTVRNRVCWNLRRWSTSPSPRGLSLHEEQGQAQGESSAHKSQTGETTKLDTQLWTLIYPEKSKPCSQTDKIHSWGCSVSTDPAPGKKCDL